MPRSRWTWRCELQQTSAVQGVVCQNIVAPQRILTEACSLSLCLFLQRRQRAAIGGVYLFLPLNKLPRIEELFLMPGAGAGASAASALDL